MASTVQLEFCWLAQLGSLRLEQYLGCYRDKCSVETVIKESILSNSQKNMFTKRAKIGYSPQMASIHLITSKDRHDQSENWATINKCKVDIVIKLSIFKGNNSPRVASTQQVKFH